jgi:nucleoside-diphosphate-sugar epimerase
MRALFLGGTGFTGPYAVRELAQRGHEVAVFHRGNSEPELPVEVRHVHEDLEEFEAHLDELRGLEPDVVVDMCAFVPMDGRRVHAFKGLARRGVVVSSSDVYRAFGRLWRSELGPMEPLPLTEDSSLREVVIDERYDKVGVEREAQGDPDFPVTILRYPAVHGPGDSLHRLYGYVRRMDDARPAILLEETHARWRWVRGYVEDVGHALALAVESDTPGRVYNVAAQVAYTEEEWVRVIADVIGWGGRIVAAPRDALPEAMRPDVDFSHDYVVDSSRIREELRYAEVVDERAALERTIAWERANPPAEPALDYEAEDAALAALTD